MNYLRITNKGLIVAEDMMLIGSSTKREDDTKIGMFGSGWKYALAWLMRNDCVPMIYSGNKELKVDFEVVMHRDTPVRVITIDGIRTSLTTEMGPQWTGWMAIREILSNAIDEGEYTIERDNSLKSISNEHTTIYIPMNGELLEVMDNFDKYFTFGRTPDYFNKYGAVFIKEGDQTPMNIYRKGIRCYNSDSYEKSNVDFSFEQISINESRLTETHNIRDQAYNFACDDENIPANIFLAILKSDWTFISSDYTKAPQHVITVLTQLINEGVIFTTAAIKRMGGDMLVRTANAVAIPGPWYKQLLELGLVKDLFELINGSNELFMRTDAKDVTNIKKYLALFNRTSVEIRTDKCESHLFINDNVVYINDNTRLSDEQLAGMIMSKTSYNEYATMIKQMASQA